jgi:predicted transcriptional regulator
VTGGCAIIHKANAQKTGALAAQCSPLAAETTVDKIVMPLTPAPLILLHCHSLGR